MEHRKLNSFAQNISNQWGFNNCFQNTKSCLQLSKTVMELNGKKKLLLHAPSWDTSYPFQLLLLKTGVPLQCCRNSQWMWALVKLTSGVITTGLGTTFEWKWIKIQNHTYSILFKMFHWNIHTKNPDKFNNGYYAEELNSSMGLKVWWSRCNSSKYYFPLL